MFIKKVVEVNPDVYAEILESKTTSPPGVPETSLWEFREIIERPLVEEIRAHS